MPATLEGTASVSAQRSQLMLKLVTRLLSVWRGEHRKSVVSKKKKKKILVLGMFLDNKKSYDPSILTIVMYAYILYIVRFYVIFIFHLIRSSCIASAYGWSSLSPYNPYVYKLVFIFLF